MVRFALPRLRNRETQLAHACFQGPGFDPVPVTRAARGFPLMRFGSHVSRHLLAHHPVQQQLQEILQSVTALKNRLRQFQYLAILLVGYRLSPLKNKFAFTFLSKQMVARLATPFYRIYFMEPILFYLPLENLLLV